MGAVAPEPSVATLLRLALPLLALAGSALLLWLGRDRPGRALALDAAGLAALLALVLALAIAPLSRDAVGLLFVAATLARLAPAAPLVRSGLAAGALAFALYAPLAAWAGIAAAPYGDQVHYLLAADRLGSGSLDATIDPRLFRALIGVDPGPGDQATHVIQAPAGARSVQGPALPALLVPGWLLAGPLGAQLVMALLGALLAAQTWLLLREAVPGGRPWRLAFLATAFLAPVLPLATQLYPNVLGALLAVTAYRWLFTRARALPLAAGAILGATLLVTPRDGLLLLALAPFALRRHGRPFAVGAVAALAVALGVNALVYGLPVPYAGYLYGTQAAQVLEQEPSLSFRFWVGLPAMLFDRTFGLAAVAPWAFLALAGLVPALRERRAMLLPAVAAAGVTLGALSLFRYWEGGYAPPARYLVEVVPLLAPFVAYGIAAAGRWISGALLALGALATYILAAIPTTGLNSAFEHKLRDQVADALGLDPLRWLPSFQPVTPEWWIAAYLRLIPALLAVAALYWLGRRRASA